jgi:hypothetical protein
MLPEVRSFRYPNNLIQRIAVLSGWAGRYVYVEAAELVDPEVELLTKFIPDYVDR